MSGRRARIAVVDYGIGNLRSAEKVLQHVGADGRLTADPAEIAAADAVVLPGVGAFGSCMAAIERSGLRQVACDAAVDGRPFLAICIGMQMLFEGSQESPNVDGLGVLAGEVIRIPGKVKLPQMQWNRISVRPQADGVLEGLDGTWMYFVHSYAARPAAPEVIAATCDYGGEVVAAVQRGSLWATQFHPEKSADAGVTAIRNFVSVTEQAMGR